MKRDAFYSLAVGMIVALAAPAGAQTNGQAPTPGGQPAPPPQPAEVQGSEQNSKSAVTKDKICAPVLIRAGPNQGQVISKCRHTDRDKGQTSG